MFQKVAIALLFVAAPVFAQPNPYSVAGADWSENGVMEKLGIPGEASSLDGSIAYVWNSLKETNPVNMVRPRRYWEHIGANPERIQGYDHVNDELCYPVEFGQWVLDHPGTIWIIGNEPDMGPGQDGLTPAEYARMFHTFHVFIREQGRDPTAKLATAGLGALAFSHWLDDDIAWWNDALAEYQTQFGTDMPIDIWNSHCYAIAGWLDPDDVIDTYFVPFMTYTRTLSQGLYVNTEFWVTEFAQGDCGQEIGAEYMKQICPRLEAIGVDRFFWFMGPWADSVQDSVLTGPTPEREPTLLGQTYAALAHSYPNPIPPPSPSQRALEDPPPWLISDFETAAAPWTPVRGSWTLDNGALRQDRLNSCWTWSYVHSRYGDVSIDLDFIIHEATNPERGIGVSVRAGFVWNDGDTMTCLIFLRQNGELAIYTEQDGTVAGVLDAVADTSQYHHVRILAIGSQFEVSIDDQPLLTWEDPSDRKLSGLVALRTCNADASFDNVDIRVILPADQDIDGDVDQADFGVFQRCYSGSGVPQDDPECARCLLDHDDDVDQGDFGVFQGCMSGANVAADPHCAD